MIGMPKMTNYSKATKKRKIAVPARLRKEHSIEATNMESSAGSLSKHADAKDILKELIGKRNEEPFR